LQPHIYNAATKKQLEKRFKNPKDPLKLVIVRDMWLTGFDAPSLHTMYVDKPMRGHGLMQAIARVNRVFRDEPGGLVVDYLGVADQLRRALADYTEAGGTGKTAIDQVQAVTVFHEKYEIVTALFHGFDRSKFFSGTPNRARLRSACGARARCSLRTRAVSAGRERGLAVEGLRPRGAPRGRACASRRGRILPGRPGRASEGWRRRTPRPG